MNPYETQKLLSEYLFFHYGKPDSYLTWPFGPVSALQYPVRCVVDCFDLSALHSDSRALDIGCAVGRSTFEFAFACGEAIGIDYSHAFVDAAAHIAREGELEYEYLVEGELTEKGMASRPEGLDPNRVHFEQGDAMALREDLGQFDAVLAANLICRLPQPEAFLDRCVDLVKPGGQLVINTPFTWLGEFTPPARWLGGRPETGESLEVLVRRMDPYFKLAGTDNMPFLIREHRRKYQWSVAQSCRFIRRDA